MKKSRNISRRSFLSNASGAVGSGWLATQWPAMLAVASVACSRREADTGYKNISTELGQALSAMAEQIIPSDDDSPGAREAGVIWFMDAWLGDGGKGMVSFLGEGVNELDGMAGGPGRFAAAGFDEQTSILKQIESGGFFSAVRFLTIVGMFAMPAYGGNKNKSGWELVGFKDQHAWQPPFGNYDPEIMKAEKAGNA